MSTNTQPDPVTLSPALRFICGFNAAVWLFAKPPWFQSDALATVTAIAGALLWLLLGVFGNRPGRARQATLAAAILYAVLLLVRSIEL